MKILNKFFDKVLYLKLKNLRIKEVNFLKHLIKNFQKKNLILMLSRLIKKTYLEDYITRQNINRQKL